MGRTKAVVIHDFYCINCGRAGLPLPRLRGHLHSKEHRKSLYCPFCKCEINHVECSTYEEVLKFKEDFAEGKYVEEAKESLEFLKNGGK